MQSKNDITQCVSGRLGRLKRQVSNIYRRHLSQMGVTESQVMILLTLLEFKSIEQNELAKMFALEKSSLSRNLVRLQKMGYVGKSSDYHPTLSLTSTGTKFAKRLYPIWQRAMNEVSQMIGKEGFESLSILESKM